MGSKAASLGMIVYAIIFGLFIGGIGSRGNLMVGATLAGIFVVLSIVYLLRSGDLSGA